MVSALLCHLYLAHADDTNVPCGPSDGRSVTEQRQRGVALYAAGRPAAADLCLTSALARVTAQLESLAAEAEAIRAYRMARQASPDAPVNGGAEGCLVGADGSQVCLGALAGRAEPSSSLAVADGVGVDDVAGCTSQAEALAFLQRIERGECHRGACDAAPAALEEGLLVAARRHWWEAARGVVGVLRGVPSFQISTHGRRALTEIRDGAGSVLSLLRQTSLDEATISCAVQWAQGESSVHLNVKFAARLDAPVTVLNVDNEEVSINASHVTFRGLGRQKPKVYTLNIELFGEAPHPPLPSRASLRPSAPSPPPHRPPPQVDAAASNWSFGSVGTVRFVLQKAERGEWKRLTKGADKVKNHRVWWEHQEKVQAEDRARRKAEREAAEAAERAEQLEQEGREKAEREKAEAEEKAARRATQAAALEAALASLRQLAAGGAASAEGSAEGGDEGDAAAADGAAAADSAAAADGAAATDDPIDWYDRSRALASAALEAVGQGGNESATSQAESLVNGVRSLGSIGFEELTRDALEQSQAQFKALVEGFMESAPKPKRAKKKRKKAKLAKESTSES